MAFLKWILVLTLVSADLFAAPRTSSSKSKINPQNCHSKISKNADGTQWNKTLLKKALKALWANGYVPNSSFLNKSRDKQARNIVEEAVGFSTTIQRLWFWSQEFYGDLPSALTAARLPIEKIIGLPAHKQPWDKEKIRIGLIAWAEAGYEISAKALKNGQSEAEKAVVSEAVGFLTRPRILLEKANEFFGKLADALWDKETVTKVLVALYEAGYLPNQTLFKYHDSRDEKLLSVMAETAGFPVLIATPHAHAKRLFGSLRNALKESGLPVHEIFHPRPSQPWDKKLVHKCLRVLWENGFTPKVYFLYDSRNREAERLIMEVTGFETTLSTLLKKSKEFHENDHTAALEAAGLPVEEILEVRRENVWSKPLVQMVLRELYAKGFKPRATLLQKNSFPEEAQKLMDELIGWESTFSTLYYKTVEFHDGNFQQGLLEAGLPVRDIVGKLSRLHYTKEGIYRALRALYENGFRPSATFLAHSKNTNATEIASEAMGFPITLSSLVGKARDMHEGNFQLALKKAGLPIEKIVTRLNTEKLTDEKLLEALRVLFRHGYLPNTATLTSANIEAQEILSIELGFSVTLKTIFDHIRNGKLKTVNNAIEAAGLPLNKIVLRGQGTRFFTTELIKRGLLALTNAGFTPYAPYIRNSSNSQAQQIWTNIVGEDLELSSLYVQADRLFRGGYNQALKEAGLEMEKIKQRFGRASNNEWNADKVILGLTSLFNEGIKPSKSNLYSNNPEILRFLSDKLGFLASPSSLYIQSRRIFGSYRQALLAAKLPAHEILARLSRDVDLLATEDVQREREEVDGELKYTNYIGSAPETPEDFLEKGQIFELASSVLPEELVESGQLVLDVILSLDGSALGPDDIVELIGAEENINVSEAAEILQYLSQSEEIREYLLSEF